MPVEVDTDREEVRATRRIRHSGNSVVVTIPRELLVQARIYEGDEVTLVAPFDGGEIRIEKGTEGVETTSEAPADD